MKTYKTLSPASASKREAPKRNRYILLFFVVVVVIILVQSFPSSSSKCRPSRTRQTITKTAVWILTILTTKRRRGTARNSTETHKHDRTGSIVNLVEIGQTIHPADPAEFCFDKFLRVLYFGTVAVAAAAAAATWGRN